MVPAQIPSLAVLREQQLLFVREFTKRFPKSSLPILTTELRSEWVTNSSFFTAEETKALLSLRDMFEVTELMSGGARTSTWVFWLLILCSLPSSVAIHTFQNQTAVKVPVLVKPWVNVILSLQLYS